MPRGIAGRTETTVGRGREGRDGALDTGKLSKYSAGVGVGEEREGWNV